MRTFSTIVEEIAKRPKMESAEYWQLIVSSAEIVFWECQEQNKGTVAKQLGLSPQEFSLVYKMINAIVRHERRTQTKDHSCQTQPKIT